MKEKHVDSKFKYEDEKISGESSGSYDPPEEPLGSKAFGITAEEGRLGESFEERTKHINPEVNEIHDFEEVVGRLVDNTNDVPDLYDGESNSVGTVVEEDDEDFSAEESAMRVIKD